MRIAIVGAGAIGSLFGARLYESGHDVLLVHHDQQTVASIRRKGAFLKSLSGRTIRIHVDASLSLSKTDAPDLVFLTVKAYDTENAAKQLRKVLDSGTPILSLQNGFGNVETLCRYLPKRSILAGTTTEAALKTGPGAATHTGRGLTWIGELDGSLTSRNATIVDLLRNAGFRTLASRNIRGVMWSKAIVNSAINPISALTRLENRDLLRVSELSDAALQLVKEGITVAKACGVSLTPSPKSMLPRVLAASGRNRSSMLKDIEAGKRTEIRQLNGSLVSVGRRLGVDVPRNALMLQLVLGLEGSRPQS